MAADPSHIHGEGGNQQTAIASGAGTTVVKAAPGRLCVVSVTVAPTAVTTFYDNASAASGNVLLTIPANATVGTIYRPGILAVNGIVVAAIAGSAGITIGYC